jgi:hypothetical protein
MSAQISKQYAFEGKQGGHEDLSTEKKRNNGGFSTDRDILSILPLSVSMRVYSLSMDL